MPPNSTWNSEYPLKGSSILESINQLWKHLSNRRKFQLFLLLISMVASAFAEVISLASVLPFLTVLANPESLWQQSFINQWSILLGIEGPEGLMLPVTCVFAFTAIVAGLIRMFNIWLSAQLVACIGSDLSCEIYKTNLFQPYVTHLKRNSSSMIASATSEVNNLIGGFLYPLLTLSSSGLIVISLIITLLAIQPFISIGAVSAVCLVYFVAMRLTNKPLQRMGHQRLQYNRKIIQTLQEGMGAIRDVLLDGSQSFYTELYNKSDRPYRKIQANSFFIGAFPKLVLEPSAMAVIAITGFILVSQGDVTTALPTLGTLALGAQRLLPLAQRIFESFAATRGAKASLNNVLFQLNQKLPDISALKNGKPVPLKEGIRFEDIGFKYSKEQKEVIEGLNLQINKGERIGLIGKTGSGKSTTIDLLMGLLYPSSGKILIDNKDIHDEAYPERIANWRATIAHVPQTIYLSDSSIAENIAFGMQREEIDIQRVKFAAQQAQILEYIESTHNGYETFVGERGIRLSGGQRQRIGIARALYKNAKVLVFDEATSALDNETENAVMQSIGELNRELTIIMIAHRLSTVARCDRVIKIQNGKIVLDGSPKEVIGDYTN